MSQQDTDANVKTLRAARETIERLHRDVASLTAERDALALERAAFAEADRVRLCTRLVTEGGKAPATVWASPDSRTPKKYLAKLSLAELRELVDSEISATPKALRSTPRPPTTSNRHGLSERELGICRESGCDPAVFAALKARREAAER